MRVFSKRTIRDFAQLYSDSRSALFAWYKIMDQNCFDNFSTLKAAFPSVDKCGTCFIFNIGGNKYRLIAKINFEYQKLYIRNILTHKDYDKGGWKNEC